jgi:hypothetical protein
MKGAHSGFGFLLAALAAPAFAQQAKPLFADDSVIRIAINGPVDAIARAGEKSRDSHPGTLTVAGSAAPIPISLSPRGITRRKKDVCQFPPLRVDFTQPQTSGLFAGQKRLKLVTHCRPSEGFQQHALLEYAAYRLYNALTPLSYRVRLAQIDYSTATGKAIATRYGFFIEDPDDMAKRNGLRDAPVGARVPVSTLSPAEAARYGVFRYLIADLDWAMQAGPAGDTCCHNGRLLAPAAAMAPLVPVPYDFDFSGFVDAPYAVPPEVIKVSSVRVRRYRGFCRHNAEALRAAAEIRVQRPALIGLLATIPGLESRARARASAFLERGFADITTDQAVTENLLKTCVG